MHAPFDIIWPSLGTPTSDATEERNWRKLIHRALFVRNRDPKAPSHHCRLRCGNTDESVIHLIRCMNTRPFWNAVVNFLTITLGTPRALNMERLLIFNVIRDQPVSVESRAFIRHAVNHFYRDFAMVDTHAKIWTWEVTFNRAMQGYRDAVLTWAQELKVFSTNRMYTAQKKQVARDTLQQFETLIHFQDSGFTFRLTPAFLQAIKNAEDAAEAGSAT